MRDNLLSKLYSNLEQCVGKDYVEESEQVIQYKNVSQMVKIMMKYEAQIRWSLGNVKRHISTHTSFLVL